jgi:spore maturation protein CgeB
MEILILDTFYPEFLADHYKKNPGLAEQSYADQWRSLMATFFGTADSYSHHLAPLGHEAHELVVNCGSLQLAWAREQRVRLPARAEAETILFAQAEAFEPDVVYVQNPHVLGGGSLDRLKAGSRLLVAQVASEPPSARLLRRYDLIVSSLPNLVERFRSLGVRSEHLRLAFDERVLRRLEEEDAPVATGGAVFVGALNRHRHRSNVKLDRAAREVPIEFWGYGLRGWSPRSALRRAHRGQAWGLDMFRHLRAARVSLNRHLNVAGPYANNMRLYEATGVGSLLLTDAKENLGELFEPRREVVTYDEVDDLVAKIRHYLGNEDERREIARAGQERTLREHTYTQRMAELAAILEDAMP